MTFEEFVSLRLTALLRYATVVTWDAHLAEDITQDVLLRAQPRWPRIAALDAPEEYVKRMVVNEFLSWRRRPAGRLLLLAKDTIEARRGASPDHSTALAERDAMQALIARLPVKQRAAIALRFYEDLSFEQIADVLGCRPGTARSHVSRALATLRTYMSPLPILTGEQL